MSRERKPLLCLNMIVKNESKIIERLFGSVISIIDSYCICDTGSTDTTIEVIRNYFKKKNIPGEVFELPFRDFGYNRNESLKRAEKWGEYALLLDADMILEIHPEFKKTDIVLDVYQLKQKNSDLDYYNTRIVRTDKHITCVGVTHEYYDLPAGVTSTQMHTLEINDVGDGGAKSDKFDRDIRLLKKGLLDDPKNSRYKFYLANSYRDHGTMTGDEDDLRKAIKWYKRRVECGGWDEELFMSCYEIGNIYHKMGKKKAINWWIEAYLHRQTRSESLYEIVKYYREKGAKYSQIAGMYYEIAKKIPYPKNDSLFIRKAVYDYLLDYEYSILAYYLGWKVDHFKYQELLCRENYNNVISNYKFYVNHLSTLNPMKKTFNTKTNINYCDDIFYPSTPSILPYKDGYIMNQRYVNYFIEPNGSYTCKEPITTYNRRIMLDHNFNVISRFDFDDLPKKVDRYAGIEDVKIFKHNDQYIFFGTEQDIKSKNLCVTTGVYPTGDESKSLVSTICESPNRRGCEKNWVYLSHNNKLKVIYQWYPLNICHLDGNQLVTEKTNVDVPEFFKHLRGSSNGYNFNKEIWFVTHLVEPSSPRVYYHCIVILDEATLKYKRHSILFKFEDISIEYCLGFIVEPNRIIFGYSKMDRETIITVFDKPSLDSLLFRGT